jgi:hypothetical protein
MANHYIALLTVVWLPAVFISINPVELVVKAYKVEIMHVSALSHIKLAISFHTQILYFVSCTDA